MPVQKVEKNEILQRCWEVFHSQGFHAASISQLAEAAGLGKAGLLHHFGSKENLMHAVLEYAMEQFRHYVLSVAQENLPPEQRLEKLLRRQNRLAKIEQRGCFFANIILETGREGWFNDYLVSIFKEWQVAVTHILSNYMPTDHAAAKAYQLLLEYEGAVTFFKLTGDERHLESFVKRVTAPYQPDPIPTSNHLEYIQL
ncbi:MAG TPA: TetR/AcrR family transcriptional regulator [Saprospiraceae bacterium]|nr:TetR/AcrR family transcriptional regulator [Saprospiraceae bacterium]HMQ81315.1 TetR/AcrR family transcriptional regulator [Saprospiraceae bacterium]